MYKDFNKLNMEEMEERLVDYYSSIDLNNIQVRVAMYTRDLERQVGTNSDATPYIEGDSIRKFFLRNVFVNVDKEIFAQQEVACIGNRYNITRYEDPEDKTIPFVLQVELEGDETKQEIYVASNRFKGCVPTPAHLDLAHRPRSSGSNILSVGKYAMSDYGYHIRHKEGDEMPLLYHVFKTPDGSRKTRSIPISNDPIERKKLIDMLCAMEVMEHAEQERKATHST